MLAFPTFLRKVGASPWESEMRREKRSSRRSIGLRPAAHRALDRLIGKLRPESPKRIPALLRIAPLRLAARFGAKLYEWTAGGLAPIRPPRWPTTRSVRARRAQRNWSGVVG